MLGNSVIKKEQKETICHSLIIFYYTFIIVKVIMNKYVNEKLLQSKIRNILNIKINKKDIRN